MAKLKQAGVKSNLWSKTLCTLVSVPSPKLVGSADQLTDLQGLTVTHHQMGGYNRWTGLDWTTGLAEIVPRLKLQYHWCTLIRTIVTVHGRRVPTRCTGARFRPQLLPSLKGWSLYGRLVPAPYPCIVPLPSLKGCSLYGRLVPAPYPCIVSSTPPPGAASASLQWLEDRSDMQRRSLSAGKLLLVRGRSFP